MDYLRGLKENVVIGKLIPAGTGIEKRLDLLKKPLPVDIQRMLAEEQQQEIAGNGDGASLTDEAEQARSLLGMGLDASDMETIDMDRMDREEAERQLQGDVAQEKEPDVDPELADALKILLGTSSKTNDDDNPHDDNENGNEDEAEQENEWQLTRGETGSSYGDDH